MGVDLRVLGPAVEVALVRRAGVFHGEGDEGDAGGGDEDEDAAVCRVRLVRNDDFVRRKDKLRREEEVKLVFEGPSGVYCAEAEGVVVVVEVEVVGVEVDRARIGFDVFLALVCEGPLRESGGEDSVPETRRFGQGNLVCEEDAPAGGEEEADVIAPVDGACEEEVESGPSTLVLPPWNSAREDAIALLLAAMSRSCFAYNAESSA